MDVLQDIPIETLTALKAKGLTHAEIGKQVGLTGQAVRGRLRRAVPTKHKPVRYTLSPDLYYPSARDINDLPAWADYLKLASNRDKMLKIMFWPDMHIPDCNWQAVALARRIRQYVKPDVDFFLGDEFDLDTVSTHWARSENRVRRDAFHEIKFHWFALQEQLTADYKSDIAVMIGGNHTQGRVEDFVNEHATAIPDTIIEAFIDICRANGQVNWMGWGDEMWIHHYHIEHGTRLGENSAKNSLKDAGWSSPRTGGHVHAPSEAWNFSYVKGKNILKPDRVIIQSVTLPALCNIHAHYAGDKKKSRWMNGVGFAYVNMNGLDVHQHKIIFHQRKNGDMVGAFGPEEFVVSQKMAKAERAA